MAHKENWDDLRIALAVVDAGSINAAAKALGVNHATVLRRMSDFERRRGFTIFEKHPRGARVASSAEAAVESLRAVEAAVIRFERMAAGVGERLSGVLHLTTTDSLAASVLPRHLEAFGAAFPAMTVKLTATNARLNLDRLDAEMTIRPAQSLDERLAGERVGAIRMSVWGAESYLRAHPSRDPAAHLWLGVTDLLSRSPVHAWQERDGKRIVFYADSFVTLAEMARAGAGLAMLPDCLASGLVRAPGFGEHYEVGVWVAAHRDLAAAPRIATCLRFFADALRADPAIRDQ